MLISCDGCGKLIEKPDNYVNQCRKRGHKIYCSTECRYRPLRIECYCSNCGKKLVKTPSELSRSKSGNTFCSKSCACSYNNTTLRKGENNPNWIDGNRTVASYIRTAYRMYKHKCSICGLEEECCLQIHHIDEDRSNDAPDNLIIVCANCHSRIHRGGLIITEEIKNNREYI